MVTQGSQPAPRDFLSDVPREIAFVGTFIYKLLKEGSYDACFWMLSDQLKHSVTTPQVFKFLSWCCHWSWLWLCWSLSLLSFWLSLCFCRCACRCRCSGVGAYLFFFLTACISWLLLWQSIWLVVLSSTFLCSQNVHYGVHPLVLFRGKSSG